MTNVKATISGNKLVIEVDLTKRFGKSASGKSITIASTNGNAQDTLPDGKVFSFGLNVYTKVA